MCQLTIYVPIQQNFTMLKANKQEARGDKSDHVVKQILLWMTGG